METGPNGNARRGFLPEDIRNFSADAMQILRQASKHVCYLINEGYDLKTALTFVGNHFCLSARQRLAVMRSVATDVQLQDRRNKQIAVSQLQDQTVYLDGFNIIITLEVLASHSPLFIGMDGAVRDLAALRGSYRLISETTDAVTQMLCVLQSTGVKKIVIFLDEPVSNSGRLKMRIADTNERCRIAVSDVRSPGKGTGRSYSRSAVWPELDIQILRDVDRQLYDREYVITSDSVILDHCRSWFNLTALCLDGSEENVRKVWD